MRIEQPQSDEEVRAIVHQLRQAVRDDCLDIRWNPEAILVRYGAFDTKGRPSEPEYDGRWEIIRYDTPSLDAKRNTIRVCLVTALDRTSKVPVMIADGPYAPLGEWLVQFMQLWNRAQSAWMAAMDTLWEEHEAASRIDLSETSIDPAHQESLEKIYREHGGAYWMGGAQGKTENAPWLGDSAVRQRQAAQPLVTP